MREPLKPSRGRGEEGRGEEGRGEEGRGEEGRGGGRRGEEGGGEVERRSSILSNPYIDQSEDASLQCIAGTHSCAQLLRGFDSSFARVLHSELESR